MLHRRTGDDEAVEILVLNVLKGPVEGNHVLLGGILGLMGGHLNQEELHLQRGIAQQAGQLGFRGDLCGHEIQQADPQGTNLLGFCPGLGHHKDVFPLQNASGWEIIGNTNGHFLPSFARD